jgi:hypothetical protein
MANPHDTEGFAARLLQQDEPLSDVQYQECRARLAAALAAAERRARLVVVAFFALMLTLMLLSAVKLLGNSDPSFNGSTVGSVATGVIFWVATATFFLSLASYYSRLWRGVKDARERFRDACLLDLQRQVRELRELVERNSRHDERDSDRPNP